MKKILFILGTRPEAIKMAPVIKLFKSHRNKFISQVCNTAQHREMTDQVLGFFSIKPDYDLNLMKTNQSLCDLTGLLLSKINDVLNTFKPDLVFVQGDTTSAFTGALAAYYRRIRIVHIEAGLRSFNKYSPFPEEINRRLVGHIADYHFAPTVQAKRNLAAEGIRKNVWVVGNPVIDSLYMGLEIIKKPKNQKLIKNHFNFLDLSQKIILVTGHRRESFGGPFESICRALKRIVLANNDYQIVYPVHLNPNVREPVFRLLKTIPHIHLIEPLDYSQMIWLMQQAHLVLTDSGGVQEEAPSLGKPVIVIRDVTERIEGVKAGTAVIVGTDENKIFNKVHELITNEKLYVRMSKAVNPYGDGKTSRRILSIIDKK